MPLPTYSSNLPEHATGHSIVFYLVLLPMGFSLPRPLPCVRCALTTPFHPYPQGAVCFLCHFPSSCDAYPLDSIVPCEARTFLPVDNNAATACLSNKVKKCSTFLEKIDFLYRFYKPISVLNLFFPHSAAAVKITSVDELRAVSAES